MRHTLICTVGTSLTNNLRHCDDKRLAAFVDSGDAASIVPLLGEYAPDERILGAEINSIHSICKDGYVPQRYRLFFLVSHTPEGRFTGRVLREYYRLKDCPDTFEKVEIMEIEGLDDSDVFKFKTDGLRNLVKSIAEIVRSAGRDFVAINATGGYKAQISFAGMIGQALDLPVYYLFEKFSDVVELPPLPVSFDLSLWLENSGQFYLLDRGWIRNEPLHIEDSRLCSLFEEVNDGGQFITCLTATGQLFHETFRQVFSRNRANLLPEPSSLKPEGKKIHYEDNNSGKHRGLENFLRKIIGFSYVKEVYTHYYNPDLPGRTFFRQSTRGIDNQIEGWFGNAGALTKFDLITTAKTREELLACIADLNEHVGG